MPGQEIATNGKMYRRWMPNAFRSVIHSVRKGVNLRGCCDMCEITYADRDMFEKYGKNIGFVSSIEDWAKKHRLNVYVAVHEHKEIKEDIVSEIKRKRPSSVLDLGCGYGFLISRLNEVCLDVRVTGTDISRFQIKNAKSREVQGSLVVCCAEYMPFKDGLFDFVVCSEVIEHVVSPKAALSEMERMLRTGGYLCISTDNPISIYRKIVKFLSRIMKRKKSAREVFMPLAVLTKLVPNTINVYKILYRCPYPLLPAVGPLASKRIGKAWVSLAQVLEKLPHINKQFYNKYKIFGVKRLLLPQHHMDLKNTKIE